MTRHAKVDLIGFLCAFVGAGIARAFVPPLEGLPSFIVPLVGAALAWLASRTLVRRLEHARNRQALRSSEATQEANDAEFARALFDDEEPDLK